MEVVHASSHLVALELLQTYFIIYCVDVIRKSVLWKGTKTGGLCKGKMFNCPAFLLVTVEWTHIYKKCCGVDYTS